MSPITRLRLFYAYGFLSSAMLDQFVWMVYLTGRGYPASSVGLAMLAFSIAYVIFNVPSSYLSDLLGRRPFLVLGPFAKVISAFLFLDAGSLGIVLAGTACAGAAFAIVTGTEEACFHDVLVSCGQEGRVNDRLSLFASAQVLGNTLGGLSGGFLAHVSYRLLYLAEAAVSALTIVAALFIPVAPGTGDGARTGCSLASQTADAIKTLESSYTQGTRFSGFLALSVASWTVYWLGRDLVQPVLGAHDIDPAVISSVFTAGGLALIAGRRIAGHFDAREHTRGFSMHMLPLAAAATAGGILGLAYPPSRPIWILAMAVTLVAGRLVSAYGSQIQEVWLLDNAPAGLKATTLSLVDSATVLFNGVCFYLLGLVAAECGTPVPLLILALACLGLHFLWRTWLHGARSGRRA